MVALLTTGTDQSRIDARPLPLERPIFIFKHAHSHFANSFN